MAMGLPVIATNWGGLAEVLTDESAFLLHPSGLVPAFPNDPQLIGYDQAGRHQWAAVRVRDIRRLLSFVQRPRNRPQVAEVGRKARQRVVKLYAREVVADAVEDRIACIVHELVNASRASAGVGSGHL